jgi:hypothetical protein
MAPGCAASAARHRGIVGEAPPGPRCGRSAMLRNSMLVVEAGRFRQHPLDVEQHHQAAVLQFGDRGHQAAQARRQHFRRHRICAQSRRRMVSTASTRKPWVWPLYSVTIMISRGCVGDRRRRTCPGRPPAPGAPRRLTMPLTASGISGAAVMAACASPRAP